ncbi:glycosyltransferase family 2 protein [Ruegeria arenilitoris]|uniref:glycosyltransferase family 2 protein n=1 Tax=Ruegeria arenilitoris TaxID=1173585 RepID=UPI0020C23D3F|nr:glycosyltransferase family 2 protein [Ruegeria arenilitoris]
MKNEGPFLLEWIAYNRIIGVSDFLIYTNDCTDHTDALLDTLSAHGVVKHLPNPAQPGQPYQMTALKAAASDPLVRDADWVFVSDVDEFLDIRTDQGTIPDLIAACGNPKAISITMRMMANGGIHHFEDRPVIEQFTHTHDAALWGGEKAIEVKTLTRRDFPLKFFGAHRPFVRASFDPATENLSWTDGSGRQVPQPFLTVANKRRRHRFPAAGASTLAGLNHYTLRSLDSYLVKSERGDVNRKYRKFQTKYWSERNEDHQEDRSITRRLTELTAEMDRLKALDGVGVAHDACVAAHRALVARLLERPEFVALRDDLIAISPALRRSQKAASV